jgi:hypothetical protein
MILLHERGSLFESVLAASPRFALDSPRWAAPRGHSPNVSAWRPRRGRGKRHAANLVDRTRRAQVRALQTERSRGTARTAQCRRADLGLFGSPLVASRSFFWWPRNPGVPARHSWARIRPAASRRLKYGRSLSDFDDLGPEVEAAVTGALAVLGELGGGVDSGRQCSWRAARGVSDQRVAVGRRRAFWPSPRHLNARPVGIRLTRETAEFGRRPDRACSRPKPLILRGCKLILARFS